MEYESAAMFVGVSEGYHNKEAAILTPEQAHCRVRSALSKVQTATKDKNTYHVYPGLAVYRIVNGCPKGGEPVAAVVTAGDVNIAIHTAEKLRAELNQSSVTVGSYIGEYGKPTVGFNARITGDLHSVAMLWQDLAEEYFGAAGIELTCGLYLTTTQLILQAEQNPEHGTSADDWKKGILSTAKKIAKQLPQNIRVHFRKAGFTYLMKA